MWWNRICLNLYLILLTNVFWMTGYSSASFSVLYFYGFFLNTDLSLNWWHNVILRLELVRTCLMKYILTKICCCLDTKTFYRGVGVDEWEVFCIPGWGLWLCLIWKPDWKLDLANSEIDVSTQFHTLPFEKFLFSFQDHTEKNPTNLGKPAQLWKGFILCHPASSDWDFLSHKCCARFPEKGVGLQLYRSHLSLSVFRWSNLWAFRADHKHAPSRSCGSAC